MTRYSQGEELLLLHLRAEGVPEPVRELAFAAAEGRRWRFDFAWPGLMLAVEVEGGTRGIGRHNWLDGYEEDCRKYNAAVRLGWRVLRYTTRQVTTGEAVRDIVALRRAWSV